MNNFFCFLIKLYLRGPKAAMVQVGGLTAWRFFQHLIIVWHIFSKSREDYSYVSYRFLIKDDLMTFKLLVKMDFIWIRFNGYAFKEFNNFLINPDFI